MSSRHHDSPQGGHHQTLTAQNRILVLGAVAAAVILALVLLQSLGNKPIRGDYDLPPLASGRR